MNARTHEINRGLDNLRERTIDRLLQDLASRMGGMGRAEQRRAYAADAYDRMSAALQSRDLTINIVEKNWFSKENPFDTYSQMYERAVDKSSGVMVLDSSDPKNPPDVRAWADDRVTFPPPWQTAPERPHGLSPGTQPGHQIMAYMMAGERLIPESRPTRDALKANLRPTTKPDGKPGFMSGNLRFNPKTKQVFAALNYGCRPHGANTLYGTSYLILKPSLKVNAIYFPLDTFFLKSGAAGQVSYQTLGAIYLKADPNMRRSLILGCLDDVRLHDTNSPQYLLEAHIFAEVRFNTDVTDLVLDKTKCNSTIIDNAIKFCLKHNVRLREC